MSVHSGLAGRSIGASSLWFYGVAASAPLTVLAAGVVTTFSVSGVTGVPSSYLLLTVGLWLLSVGSVAMNRRLEHAAPFFALLSRGLRRPWGVADGLLALVGYNALQVALYSFLGATLAPQLGGAWWLWAAVVWAAVAVLGVLRVDIGAGVLAAGGVSPAARAITSVLAGEPAGVSRVPEGFQPGRGWPAARPSRGSGVPVVVW